MPDLDDARDAATQFINAEDRGPAHVALGVAVTVGFAIAATVLARRTITPVYEDETDDDHPVTERPHGPLGLILPAVFSITTVSALRVWNAPPAKERSNALGLWAAAQAVNAVWIALRPAGRLLQVAAAMSSAGLAAAFAHEAGKLDQDTGKMAAPIGGDVRLANKVHRQVNDGSTGD
jgi:benzodiazapine receptor